LVGGSSGNIYRTINYNPLNSPQVNWQKLTTTPISTGVTIRNIVIAHRTVNGNNNTYYYAAAFAGDVCFSPGTTPGLYESINNGSWTALSSGLLPGDPIWKFAPLGSSTNTFVAPMYGGNVMKLVDNQ